MCRTHLIVYLGCPVSCSRPHRYYWKAISLFSMGLVIWQALLSQPLLIYVESWVGQLFFSVVGRSGESLSFLAENYEMTEIITRTRLSVHFLSPIPVRAYESFRVKRSSGRAGTVSTLLHSLIIYLFQWEFLLKYMKYYQTEQIGVGPCMNFQQIGTNDMEWLIYCPPFQQIWGRVYLNYPFICHLVCPSVCCHQTLPKDYHLRDCGHLKIRIHMHACKTTTVCCKKILTILSRLAR